MDYNEEDWQHCSACSGSGMGYSGHEDDKCNTCNGRGEVFTGEVVEPDEREYNSDDRLERE